jgi:hypothetical protein
MTKRRRGAEPKENAKGISCFEAQAEPFLLERNQDKRDLEPLLRMSKRKRLVL